MFGKFMQKFMQVRASPDITGFRLGLKVSRGVRTRYSRREQSFKARKLREERERENLRLPWGTGGGGNIPNCLIKHNYCVWDLLTCTHVMINFEK